MSHLKSKEDGSALLISIGVMRIEPQTGQWGKNSVVIIGSPYGDDWSDDRNVGILVEVSRLVRTSPVAGRLLLAEDARTVVDHRLRTSSNSS